MGSGAPTHLRVEHDPRLLGIGVPSPRLSWWLPAGVVRQRAARIEATVDGRQHSAVLEGEESVLRPWLFPPLGSRSRVGWRVQVQTAGGWSEWSEPASFEVGLLEVADWHARFVGLEAPPEGPRERGDRGAVYLRRSFAIDERPATGRIYATAHGIYELHLDGHRVGDLELTPGFTAYRSHLEVQTYDITDLLSPGEHQLVATLTDGWWRGSVGAYRVDRQYGDSLALLAQVEAFAGDGRRVVIGTDEEWEVCDTGPIVAADLMEGERIDQRVPFPPRHGWAAAAVLADPDERLTVSPSRPTRRVEWCAPTSITRLNDSIQVVDLGRNINGWLQLHGATLGPAGNHVQLRHGEMLGAAGDLDTDHLIIEDYPAREPKGPGQIDEVVSAAPAAADFEPRHTTHGFQYVSISGANDIGTNQIRGVLVQTDLERTGWFRCSDERLNALHEATVLSFRGNACEIPTDCPQRERAGWTGDWQVFVAAAAFLYDVAGFNARWLRDLAADQWDDGRVTNFVPDPLRPGARGHADYITGSAGWGDAAVLVPWESWQAYGDAELLERQYPSMVAWAEFGLRRAAGHRHPDRIAARPVAAPHERYLWDIGFHWGEWLEPQTAEPWRFDADQGHVATAYLHHSLAVLAQIASIIGRRGDVDRFSGLAEQVRAAWQAEYVGPDGTVSPATQATLVRALRFDLVDAPHRPGVLRQLVERIRQAGTHVGTGFLATPFLLPVLADEGEADLAYELLLQASPPSWLHMIESGATTVWENWEGLDSNGQGSLNHYSKGAVITFLHRYVAGLRPVAGVPAYRRFEVRPCLGGGITGAEATLRTPYGPIRAAWRRVGSDLHLDVDVAPGTMALVTLPGGPPTERGPGRHTLRARWPGPGGSQRRSQ